MRTPWYMTVQGKIVFVVPEPNDMMVVTMCNVIVKAHGEGKLSCSQLIDPDFKWLDVTLS